MSARIEHGRSAWQTGRCRCSKCRRALVEYHRLRRAVRVVLRGGEPATRVSPARVRRHVEGLRAAGWTLTAIARAAGVSRTTVDRLAHGHLAHCSRITARAVLAVRP